MNPLFRKLLATISLLSTAAWAAPVGAQDCTCTPASGVVSWWAGDGDAKDLVGGNNGTLVGGATFATGKVGQAFSFNGTSAVVVVPHNANLDLETGSFSAEWWMYPTASDGYRQVWRKQIPGVDGNGMMALVRDGAVSFFYPDNAHSWNAGSEASIATNEWTHVAAVYDAAAQTKLLYVNGVLASSETNVPVGTTNGEPVIIGHAYNSPGATGDLVFPFAGLIDELTLYQHALTSDEVAAIFAAGSAGKCKAQAPVADAGPNQTILEGQTVQLDGSGSYASNTPSSLLLYSWTFVSRPAGSTSVLSGANTATPSFVADAAGMFIAQLVVTDPSEGLPSSPSLVSISSTYTPPTADAGPAEAGVVGRVMTLHGSGSDPNGLGLTYSWSFVSKPAGSAAALGGTDTATPSFTPDLAGSYSIGLMVSDAYGSSPPATVVLSVITGSDYAQNQLHDALNYIAAMPGSQFQAPGHRNSISNLLQQAMTALQGGNTALAKSKLKDAMIRTDGFPVRGALDAHGPSMDWITDATAQGVVYQALINALSVLP